MKYIVIIGFAILILFAIYFTWDNWRVAAVPITAHKIEVSELQRADFLNRIERCSYEAGYAYRVNSISDRGIVSFGIRGKRFRAAGINSLGGEAFRIYFYEMKMPKHNEEQIIRDIDQLIQCFSR